jgi:hypothetical protein
MLNNPKWDKVDTKTRDILITARALIENPHHWCQHSFQWGEARCATEAISVAAKLTASGPEIPVNAELILSKVMGMNVTVFNDRYTHADVLAAFDKAIKIS